MPAIIVATRSGERNVVSAQSSSSFPAIAPGMVASAR